MYFSTGDGTNCTEISAFNRTVDSSLAPAAAAFNELTSGPTPSEMAAGASSFFSPSTAGAITSVGQAGGLLIVDLDNIQAQISTDATTCDGVALTASLTATAFQFPTADRARYLLAGSCQDFSDMMQIELCEFEHPK
ncbi:MAG: GerMN domain-containing protein [Acidimicrobiales bacterium]